MPMILLIIGLFLSILGLSKFVPALENYISEARYKKHIIMLVVIVFALFGGCIAVGVMVLEGILKILQTN